MSSQPGRVVLRPVDPPRPLKSSLKQPSIHSTYEVQSIEELLTLIENIAGNLAAGICNAESINVLAANMRILGVQVEMLAKETLDRAFVSFRNASQDERISIRTRLSLLELIELRAKGWHVSDDLNAYYKQKANIVEPDSCLLPDISTSPHGLLAAGTIPLVNNSFLLAPGELIRNSGKFTKPTKIPGKNYSKDEVIIRNADSGKVMGIKGRRVHMIEELSETIISFQRVNPGAKERLVQITGPSEEKINYAKQLIEDTIRRNASPVRLEAHEEDGCSSMASSTSDEQPRHKHTGAQPKAYRPHQQTLLHSYSTSDASLGEYKFTVSVGGSSVKITGDNLELVRAAKLVLEDYFSSAEFGADVLPFDPVGYDGYPLNPNAPPMVPMSHQLSVAGSSMADSGIALDKLATGRRYQKQRSETDGDDDVFIVEDNGTLVSVNALKTSNSSNGISRSKKTTFRKSASPDSTGVLDHASLKQEIDHENKVRMTYQLFELLDMAKSKRSMALPHDWIKICEKWPGLVRNKDLSNSRAGETFETIVEEVDPNESSAQSTPNTQKMSNCSDPLSSSESEATLISPSATNQMAAADVQ